MGMGWRFADAQGDFVLFVERPIGAVLLAATLVELAQALRPCARCAKFVQRTS